MSPIKIKFWFIMLIANKNNFANDHTERRHNNYLHEKAQSIIKSKLSKEQHDSVISFKVN